MKRTEPHTGAPSSLYPLLPVCRRGSFPVLFTFSFLLNALNVGTFIAVGSFRIWSANRLVFRRFLRLLFAAAGRLRRRGRLPALRRFCRLFAEKHGQVMGVHHLALQQSLRHEFQRFEPFGEKAFHAAVTLFDDLCDFLVDGVGNLVTVIPFFAEVSSEEHLMALAPQHHGPQRAHAVLGNHAARQLSGALKIVAGPSGDVAENQVFGDPSAKQNADVVGQTAL